MMFRQLYATPAHVAAQTGQNSNPSVRSVYDLLKGLSGVKQIGLSDLVAEALDRYLEDEDNQTLIEYHRLDKSEVDGTERRHSD